MRYITPLSTGGSGTPDDGSVTAAKVAAATLVTAADTIAANDDDTTWPTSAAVKDYADALGGGDVAGDTHAATSKTTPVDADEIPLIDSAASFGLKKLTWANLKAAIKSYYDSVTATLTNKTLDNTNVVTARDDRFTLQDSGDTTKQAVFQLSGISTGTTRTITVPDSDVTLGSGGGGGGDASTNTSTSVDNEIALFSGTGGKTLKRATTTGVLKATSGVIAAATAGTDYTTPSSTETQTNKTLAAGSNTITGIVSKGVYSSAPAAGKDGRIYLPTDISAVLYDNGSSIDRFILPTLIPATAVPSSSWTTVNLGSSTVAANKDGRLFTLASIGANSIALEHRTLSPTSNYTFTAFLDNTYYRAGAYIGGILLREAATGEIITFGPGFDVGNGNANIAVSRHTTSGGVTAFAGYDAVAGGFVAGGYPRWFRIRDDNTNHIFEFSWNGVDWIEFFSQSRTAYLTADTCGWGASNNGSGKTSYLRLRSWAVV